MKSIVIQQTLHGYSEGHRLLDGSIKLGDDVARLVLRMSDLSGSNVASGFEDYLTAYPLKSANMYAFAKTWYAAEMPRPGCVWTHTLFISASNMAEIPDLQALTALFVRPQNSGSNKQFSQPIEFEMKEAKPNSLPSSSDLRVQIADLIESLYVQHKDNILIVAHNSRAYEAALIRLWSQQWPQLRNAFTFSTGALSARGFAGKPFDVQCTHPSLVREMTSGAATNQSGELALLVKPDTQQPSWFTTAADDAVRRSGGSFRRLLWEFADTPDRKLFGYFAQLIEKFLDSSEHSVDEALGMVAEIFPGEHTGTGLKSAIFGGRRRLPGLKSFEEGEILSALASTPYHGAFSSEGLQLKTRGRDLCNHDRKSARQTISRLFRSPVNRLGEDILAGMIEAVSPAMAKEITSEEPQFLPALFRAKPELGASAELWTAAGDRKRELLESLISNSNLEEGLIEGIAQALLDSDSEFLLRRALETWGQPMVFGVFDWIAKDKGQLSEISIAALTFHIESIVKWLLTTDERPQNAIVTAAHIVGPYTYEFKRLDSGVWLRAFRDLVQQKREREANYFATLLLALGFQNAPPEALTLIEECFSRVHQNAWDNVMPDDTWIIVNPIVPHLWWHDWDKCERLRRGLAEAFVRHKWPPKRLADCVKDPVLLPLVIESAKKVDGGRVLTSQAFGS